MREFDKISFVSGTNSTDGGFVVFVTALADDVD